MRFLDEWGDEVPDGGEGLERIARIDASRLDERVRATPTVVASDVMSPLLGPEGAAAVFGPQKGATPQQVAVLERGLAVLAGRIGRDLGIDVRDLPGAGAAGGAGAMLLALGATLRSGAEVVLGAIGFDERLAEADLVVTGEGRLDRSTLAGKAPAVVARRAREAGVPCAALCGVSDLEPGDPFDEIRTLADHFGGDVDEAQRRAAPGLQALAARLGSDRRHGARR